jgi:hypothetical protein
MKQLKVYGERNSGTIYLEWLLRKNFEIEILETPETGWKHRIAPSQEEIAVLEKDIHFVCLVKNPYSWLISMHKRPYMHEELKKLSFSDFLKYSYGDYRNPIVMWNLKNKSYLEMGNYTNQHIIVKYETLLQNISIPLSDVALKFNITPPPLFKNIKSLLTNSHGISSRKFHTDHYLEEKWKHSLSTKHIELINQFLDKELMDKFNYSYL